MGIIEKRTNTSFMVKSPFLSNILFIVYKIRSLSRSLLSELGLLNGFAGFPLISSKLNRTLLKAGFTYKMFGNVPSNALASVMIIESLIA
jgi:hypothetical protein